VFEFASKGQYAHIVAALSALCSAPIPLMDELLQSKHREAILIACKAAELEWPTVKAILNCRAIARKMSDLDVDSARGFSQVVGERGAARAALLAGQAHRDQRAFQPARAKRTSPLETAAAVNPHDG
jgi:Uncharacterised protein conserved in bacteria (DUF2336)